MKQGLQLIVYIHIESLYTEAAVVAIVRYHTLFDVVRHTQITDKRNVLRFLRVANKHAHELSYKTNLQGLEHGQRPALYRGHLFSTIQTQGSTS